MAWALSSTCCICFSSPGVSVTLRWRPGAEMVDQPVLILERTESIRASRHSRPNYCGMSQVIIRSAHRPLGYFKQPYSCLSFTATEKSHDSKPSNLVGVGKFPQGRPRPRGLGQGTMTQHTPIKILILQDKGPCILVDGGLLSALGLVRNQVRHYRQELVLGQQHSSHHWLVLSYFPHTSTHQPPPTNSCSLKKPYFFHTYTNPIS